jgi:3'-5' exoribonuclease
MPTRREFQEGAKPLADSPINAWGEGDEVRSAVVVRRKRLQSFRNKPGQYLCVTLTDSTGQIEGRVWDDAERVAEALDEGVIAHVEGKIERFQDQLQLKISAITPAPPDEATAQQFLPPCRRDVEPLEQQLRAVIDSIQNPHLRRLVDAFYGEAQVMERLRRAPAGVRLHHAYVGGLVEHTVEVMSLLEVLCEHYPDINRDLVMAGALLHDIGKLEELSATTTFDYTDAGRLLGHIALSDQMVCEAMDAIEGFPEHTRLMLRHMIISHHGTREQGSPEPPKTLEAMALHMAENADAQVNRVWGTIARHRDGATTWGDWDRLLERQFYLGPVEPPEEGESNA